MSIALLPDPIFWSFVVLVTIAACLCLWAVRRWPLSRHIAALTLPPWTARRPPVPHTAPAGAGGGGRRAVSFFLLILV